MRQQRFDEAIALLNSWKGRKEQSDWLAYAQYNLGVALIRKGHVAEADPFLTSVGTLESGRRELRSLKDRANLALGFAYLQNDQPALAKPLLERVRLNGPYSNKALLGMGWARRRRGQFQEALTPWMELRDRNLLDSAVQEAYLAMPYAFAKLNANAQAAENYEIAIESFDAETREHRRVDRRDQRRHHARQAAPARRERSLRLVLAAARAAGRAGIALPVSPCSPGHDFQEGLKNYRDLAYPRRHARAWDDSMVAFDDMIDTRETAYAERVPQADALLASGRLDQYGAERATRAANSTSRGHAGRLRARHARRARAVGAHRAPRSRAR